MNAKRWLPIVPAAFTAAYLLAPACEDPEMHAWRTAAHHWKYVPAEREALAQENAFPFGADCEPVNTTLQLQSIQSVPATGGTVAMKGIGFPTTAGTRLDVLLGYPANLTIPGGVLHATVQDANDATVTIPPLTAGGGQGTSGQCGGTAGCYGVTLVSSTCASYNAGPALNVVTTVDFSTIFGSTLKQWSSIDVGATCTGGVGSACADGLAGAGWADRTVNGCNWSCTSTACPTYHTNTGHWTGSSGITASWQLDDVNDSWDITSCTLGTAAHYSIIVFRPLANSSTSRTGISINGSEIIRWRNGVTLSAIVATETANTTVTIGANTINLAVMGGWDGASTATIVNRENNIASTSTTASYATPTTGVAMHYGTTNGSTQPGAQEVVEVATIALTPGAGGPTPTQMLQAQSYIQARWGVEATLAYVSNANSYPFGISDLGPTTSTGRAVITGLNQTGSIAIAGLGALTTSFVNTTTADFSGVSGQSAGASYNVTVTTTNNNQSLTIVNGVTIKAANSASPGAAIGNCYVGGYFPEDSTCATPPCVSGTSTVSSDTDRSGLQSTITQGTGGSQFGYSNPDSNCGGKASWTGTNKSLSGNLNLDGGSVIEVLMPFFMTSATTRTLSTYGVTQGQLKWVGSTDTQWTSTGGSVNFGSGILNAIHEAHGWSDGTSVAIDKDFGTEVTTSATNTISSGANYAVGSATGPVGSVCGAIVSKCKLSGTPFNDLHTYFQNYWGTP